MEYIAHEHLKRECNGVVIKEKFRKCLSRINVIADSSLEYRSRLDDFVWSVPALILCMYDVNFLIVFGLGGFFFPYVQNFKEFKDIFFPKALFLKFAVRLKLSIEFFSCD